MQFPSSYQIMHETYLDDIDKDAIILQHSLSGAKLCVFPHADDFTFCVTVRTPSEDNTGIAHVVEHLICRGPADQDRYSTLDDIKVSIADMYFNATTRNDSTTYSISCPRDEDYRMCALWMIASIFNPRFIWDSSLFSEEGWRRECNHQDEIYGVVFNEMSQKSRDPIRLIRRSLVNSIFPDSPYGFDSGGIPEKIILLSNERCIEYYKRYYYPANMFFLISGNIEQYELLEVLDSYFQQFQGSSAWGTITSQVPVAVEKVKMGDLPFTECYTSFQAVCGTYADPIRTILTQVMIQTIEIIGPSIFSLPESCVLSCELDLFAKQPWYRITLVGKSLSDYGINPSTFRYALLRKCNEEKIADVAIMVLRSISQSYRHPQYKHVPVMVLRWYAILRHWLYDGSDPFCYLRLSSVFAQVESLIIRGELLPRMHELLSSNHYSIISNLPITCIDESDIRNQQINNEGQKCRDRLQYSSVQSTYSPLSYTKSIHISEIPLYLFETYDNVGQVDIYYDFSMLNRNEMVYLRLLVDYMKKVSLHPIHKHCTIEPTVIEHNRQGTSHKLVCSCPLPELKDFLHNTHSDLPYSLETLQKSVEDLQKQIICDIRKECRSFAANRSRVSLSKQAELYDSYNGKIQLDFIKQFSSQKLIKDVFVILKSLHSRIFRKENMVISVLARPDIHIDISLEDIPDVREDISVFFPSIDFNSHRYEWFVLDECVNTVAVSNNFLLGGVQNDAAVIVVRDIFNSRISNTLRKRYGSYNCQMWINSENGDYTLLSYLEADIENSIMLMKQSFNLISNCNSSDIQRVIDTVYRREKKQEIAIDKKMNMRKKMYCLLAGYTRHDICRLSDALATLSVNEVRSTASTFAEYFAMGFTCVVTNQMGARNHFMVYQLENAK